MKAALMASMIVLLAPSAYCRTEVRTVDRPPTDGRADFYVFNRAPLTANGLAKLPIGSISPNGWLRGQLELMADGMMGRLDENGLSPYINSESGWWNGVSPGWEEVPYWVKGLTSLAYVLDDRDLKVKARRWLDAAIVHQQDDGYFGPPENKQKNDLWPNMVMLFALQTLHEATGDQRVIPLMTRYFQWQAAIPEETLLPGSWQKVRAGDNLESVYWLYNRTGEPWLLELAAKIHRRTDDWTSGIPPFGYHGVNFAQCFRQPAVYYQQSHDRKHLDAVERNYRQLMDEYGQFPGGMMAADENCRPDKTGPQQGAETCAMVEFMYSNESLLRITGDPLYADRCEDIAFNSLPAASTPDLKGLHYVTAPNLVQCDRGHSHCFEYDHPMLLFTPGVLDRCCQHNVGQGWPYYAEHLWMATKGNGLAAVLYAESEVRAKVGDGTTVTVTEETDYPFGESVRFTIETPKAVRFPLMLRIPHWCDGARVLVNGETVRVRPKPSSYAVIERPWHDGDRVVLELPMRIQVTAWAKQDDAVSVSRGPLTYSLKIGENWVNAGGTDVWPDRELLPTTPWSYGLVLEPDKPEKSFEIARSRPVTGQPFTTKTAPIELKARARRIPDWGMELNCVGPVPKSPVVSKEPIEEVELIPMGAARLRISVFPVIK